ncbi:hypothetical protein CHM34_06480 [Paludifilum halophilum]|uniref:Uncharacterized protein n=1 Tax=Paludifilum halophilum TaxID=1642702 RepID=A0A235B888_9BACL|nr:hypothetical protein CHM34_06480 [Paludifilum halophilum]
MIKEGRQVWQGALEQLAGRPTWIYTVRNADSALRAVGGAFPVTRLDEKRIEAAICEEEVESLNGWLLSRGIGVLGIEKRTRRLEDAFVEMMSR